MFEGNMHEGELEIGQVSGDINKLQTVEEVMQELVIDFNATINKIGKYSL